MWHPVTVCLAAYLGAGLFFVLRETGVEGKWTSLLNDWPALMIVGAAWLPIALINVMSVRKRQEPYAILPLRRGYLAAPAALLVIVVVAGMVKY